MLKIFFTGVKGRKIPRMIYRRSAGLFVLCTGLALVAHGQDDKPEHHGRKYKAPPTTSHIEVLVLKKYNNKPIANAAVVFHSSIDGKDQGNLEVKTDPNGKAIIDVIQTGSKLQVQVIARGYATFGQDYLVDGPTKDIKVEMISPRAQVSLYKDTEGESSQRKPGIQEPNHPLPQGPGNDVPH